MKLFTKVIGIAFTILAVLLALAIAGLLLDGVIRGASNEPQIWETHVRYTWREKTGPQLCVVAIRGKKAQPCSHFSKESIDAMRLQWEKPSQEVLDGKLD